MPNSKDMKSLLDDLTLNNDEKENENEEVVKSKGYTPKFIIYFIMGACLFLVVILQFYEFKLIQPKGLEQMKIKTLTAEQVSDAPINQIISKFGLNKKIVLSSSGYVSPKSEATIGAEISGIIQKIFVEEGDYLEKGQIIAQLDVEVIRVQIEYLAIEVLSQQAVLDEMQIMLDFAISQKNRILSLKQQNLVSTELFDEKMYNVNLLEKKMSSSILKKKLLEVRLKEQNILLKKGRIYAPFEGVVVTKISEVGEYTTPIYSTIGVSSGIIKLVNYKISEGVTFVNEKRASSLHIGQTVDIKSTAYPDAKFKGVVKVVIPVVIKESAAIKVVIDIIEVDQTILPNMSIDIDFYSV